MKFILWNESDGAPQIGNDGTINSGGIIGRVGPENVYLKMYAHYPDNKRPSDIKVGECIHDVIFRLSGQTGVYSIYRVE